MKLNSISIIRWQNSWLGALTIAAALLVAGSGSARAGLLTLPAPKIAAPNIAGTWTLTCELPARDCSKISVTVDSSGALLDAEVPGFSGLIEGGASVGSGKFGQQLEIDILDTYTFEGVMVGDSLAQGNLTIEDIENGEEVIPVLAIKLK
ncbi:MAG TPA: hypothetical protein VMA09_02940 [Candidatus Binataceae bacterium]|nr:hypothetical protein [Candidatus Binataceae bacterium]